MVTSISQDTLGSGSSPSQNLDSFCTLVRDLSKILGPSSSINLDEVDRDALQKLMEYYISTESEWSKYTFEDLNRGYTKNLVNEGNGKSNLLVLVWAPRKGNPVHDHADTPCLMKFLKSTLQETRFYVPKNNVTAPGVFEERQYGLNEITYMSDDIGVHEISNPGLTEVAVTLHLYTPPNTTKKGRNIFNERTGTRNHVTQSDF